MANRRYDQRPGLDRMPNDPYGNDKTAPLDKPPVFDKRPTIDPMDDDRTGGIKKGK